MSSFLDVVGIGPWTLELSLQRVSAYAGVHTVRYLCAACRHDGMIQIFPKVKPVYKALFYAAAGSFIFQPLMHLISLYDPMQWQNYYSFPILAGIYMAADFFATRTRFEK